MEMLNYDENGFSYSFAKKKKMLHQLSAFDIHSLISTEEEAIYFLLFYVWDFSAYSYGCIEAQKKINASTRRILFHVHREERNKTGKGNNFSFLCLLLFSQ